MADSRLSQTQPWERMPKEPSKAHDAFRAFRDLAPGERSAAAVGKLVRMSEVQVRRYIGAWDWWERAAAWDDEVHRLEDEGKLATIAELADLQREVGALALKRARDALDVIKPEDIPPAALVRLLEFGMKMQRTAAEEDEAEVEDPWERIARELDPRSVT